MAQTHPAIMDEGVDLRRDLRDFASARPEGWNHEDWLVFLESLRDRGHNVNDRDAIGLALERERLDLALCGIRGVGPRRRNALVEHFGTIWKLRNAEITDIVRIGSVPGAVAERIHDQLNPSRQGTP